MKWICGVENGKMNARNGTLTNTSTTRLRRMTWSGFTISTIQSCSWLRVAATHYGKLLVMDIDDNFFEVHENNPSAKRYALKSKARTDLAAILSECQRTNGIDSSSQQAAIRPYSRSTRQENADIRHSKLQRHG